MTVPGAPARLWAQGVRRREYPPRLAPEWRRESPRHRRGRPRRPHRARLPARTPGRVHLGRRSSRHPEPAAPDVAGPRRHLAHPGRDSPVLSPDAHLVVGPVPPLGSGAARLPPRQRAAPRRERRRALAGTAPPGCPGRLDGGGGVRPPSRAGRVGGLGDGAEERAVGVLLPARATRLPALGPRGRRGAGRRAPDLRAVVPLVRLRRAQQERHLHAARRRRARPLVEARASRAGPDPRAGSARRHERGGGRADRVVGAALRGCGRAGVGAFPPRALSGGRACALVLTPRSSRGPSTWPSSTRAGRSTRTPGGSGSSRSGPCWCSSPWRRSGDGSGPAPLVAALYFVVTLGP